MFDPKYNLGYHKFMKKDAINRVSTLENLFENYSGL